MSLYTLCIATLLPLIAQLPSASSNNFTNCSTSISVLEKALFETAQNELKLKAAFFPPRVPPTRYIKVNYTFQFEDGSADEKCTVEYIWAIGGSLLIQPPTIFRFTSLLFNIPNNDIQYVTLELPSECRGLVETEGICSCGKEDNNGLDIITQQLKQYSKFNDPLEFIRDDTSNIQAVCSEELKRRYFKNFGVILYFVATLVFPLMLMTGIAVLTQSLYEPIQKKLSLPSNHPTLAGLILTGICSMLFVITMDGAALYYMITNKHEYKYEDVKKTFSLMVMISATFALDGLITILFISCLLYIILYELIKEEESKIRKYCLFPYFYVIYGEKVGSAKPESRLNWAVVGLMVAPMFSFASHAGYIMIAWLTEPAKTTAIALLAVIVTLFLFLTFRQCYIINKRPMTTCWCFRKQRDECEEKKPLLLFLLTTILIVPLYFLLLLLYPLYIVFSHLFNSTTPCCNKDRKETEKKDDNKTEKKEFDLKSLILSSAWMGVIMGCVAFILAAFYELPISTLQLPVYLESITQIVFVIISFLVTYKILTINETDIHKFLKSLRKHLKNDRGIPDTHDGDLEAAGELTAVIVEKLLTKETKISLTQKTRVTVCEHDYRVPEGTTKHFSKTSDGALEAKTHEVTISGDITIDKITLPDGVLWPNELENNKIHLDSLTVAIEELITTTIISDTIEATCVEISHTIDEEAEVEVCDGVTLPSDTCVIGKGGYENTLDMFPSNSIAKTKKKTTGTIKYCPVTISNGQVTATKDTRVTTDYTHHISDIVKYDYDDEKKICELPVGSKIKITEATIKKDTKITIIKADTTLQNVAVIIPENTEVCVASQCIE